MTDIKSKENRSKNMSAIKNKDTKPEIYFRKKLFSMGLRYRKNCKNIFGHPDLFLAKYNTAIFVNGCFWHHHTNCKYAYTPKSRVEFWETKFQNNIRRDQVVHQKLANENIKCLIIWECTIKNMQKSIDYEKNILNTVLEFLYSSELFSEL